MPAGARTLRPTFFGRAGVIAVALTMIVVALGGVACGTSDGGSRPSSDGDDRADRTIRERSDTPAEDTLAYGSTPGYTSPQSAPPGATTTVSASPSASNRSTGQDAWTEQAGYHYRASLGALEDALRRLDPTREVTGEDFSAITQDELALRAAAQGFRSVDPPSGLREAHNHLLEASEGLSNLSYELTEAANSFYPTDRLDDVAEEIEMVLPELDAAEQSARQAGIELDPRSEAPTPEEVGELYLRLVAKSESLERYDTLLEQTGCSEEDPCPI